MWIDPNNTVGDDREGNNHTREKLTVSFKYSNKWQIPLLFFVIFSDFKKNLLKLEVGWFNFFSK